MIIRDILTEGYIELLNNDLNGVLLGAKANGIYELKTDALVSQLQQNGYSVSSGNIINLLQDNPNVLNITDTIITLTGDSVDDADDSFDDRGEDAEQAVTDMAIDASKKELKR